MGLYSTGTAWPSNVNSTPFRDSYNEEMERNVDEFKPRSGPEIRRRIMSTSYDLIKFSLRLSAAEWAALKTFYRITTVDGTLPFMMTNPLTMTTDNFFFMDAPKIAGVKVTNYVVPISLRKVADEILIADGDGATIDLGGGSLMRAF